VRIPFPAGPEPPVDGAERAFLLLELKPGSYQLVRVERADEDRPLSLPAALKSAFELSGGTLAYPGDLHIAEVAGRQTLQQRWDNRSSRWLPLLRQAHPTILRDWPLRHVGPQADAFPAQWQDWSAAGLFAARESVRAVVAAPLSTVPALTRALFRPPTLSLASLAPDGRWLALAERSDRRLRLLLHDTVGAVRHPVAIHLDDDSRLLWCGNDCLSISHGGGRHSQVEVLRLLGTTAAPQLRSLAVPFAGYVIDPLPQAADELLYGRLDNRSGKDSLEVYRLRLDGSQIHPRQFNRSRRLDGRLRNELGWLSDAEGQLRLALGRSETGYRLLQPTPRGLPQPLLETPLSTQFDALSIVDDALLALTDAELPSRQLRRYPLDRSAPTSVAAVGPEACADCIDLPVDLLGVVLGAVDRRPLAVRFEARGLARSLGLDQTVQDRLDFLAERHPGAALTLARVSADGASWLYHIDQPGAAAAAGWWLQTDPERAPERIGLRRPWLECSHAEPPRSERDPATDPCVDGPLPPLRSEALELRSAEGGPLEAFLSLPPELHGPQRPFPLLLLPHGGPIGVRDNRSFDPVVQLFGRAGYAVLQVNYRGSLGYGRAFRDAAFGAVGGAIEADLIGALEQVLRDDRLDPARVCAVGMSYGGYSALMLAIARPEMLRCVAAYAPLTDLPLRFGSSDWNADPLQRSVQQALYGDPATELTSLQQRSPLYRFQELTQPLLLGHGLRDRRVHPEHSARLELVLRESGRPPAIHWYDNEAHGLNRVSNQIDWYGRVLAFLRRELGT
jgi:predicted esterase